MFGCCFAMGMLGGRLIAGTPVALVFEHVDGITGANGASRMLRQSGFEVREVPTTGEINLAGVDLVMLGSFLSEKADYNAFINANAAALREFVRSGGVLFQGTADDRKEPVPGFLPAPLHVRRIDDDFEAVQVLRPQHPLVARMADLTAGGQLRLARHLGFPISWETLYRQTGFNVILGVDALGTGAVLLEGEHGRGRFLLTSLALDKIYRGDALVASPEYFAFAQTFFQNLKEHVETVRLSQAPAVSPTQSVDSRTPGSWSIIVLPDTQNYVDSVNPSRPELFTSQTEWVAQQQAALNIQFTLHLGDITQTNVPLEWERARTSMNVLDGVVPYSIVAGNHDYGVRGSAATRDTLFSDFFPPAKFAGRPTFGGTMEPGKMDNNYHLFGVGDDKWMVVSLEWSPRNKTVQWAEEIVAAHPDRRVILITHAYLYYDDTRYDWAGKGTAQSWSPGFYGTANDPDGWNDGEMLWQKLVSRHRNIAMTINGHVLEDGLGFLSSAGAGGTQVQQMLVNFQMRDDGGEGYLRILEIQPDGVTVRVRDYSPALDRFLPGPQNNFTFPLRPRPALPQDVQFAPSVPLPVAAGSPLILSPVLQVRQGLPRWQWYRNGTPIAGATGRALALPAFNPGLAGTYTLEATLEGGKTSWTTQASVATELGRLANISQRSWIAPDRPAVLGFVIRGDAPVPVLLRGMGPTLANFGVAAALPDPQLAVFDHAGNLLGVNDDWKEIETGPTAGRVGAGALPGGSRDSALILQLTSGAYSAACSPVDAGEGTCLIELFPETAANPGAFEFRNFSTLDRAAGADRGVLAFVVSGAGSRTALMRAVGPTLAGFVAEKVIQNPIISVYDASGRLVATNDDWDELADVVPLQEGAATHGAFALPRGSRDAALMATLPPGAYTVVCQDKAGGAGTALLEVYDTN